MNREELERRLNDVEALITESKYTVQTYVEERKQLKKQLEELPKLVIGKWYRSKNGVLAFFSKVNSKGYFLGYGFDVNGKWFDEDCDPFSLSFNWVLEQDKEVEEVLIKEAKRRGFKEGVMIFDVNFTDNDWVLRGDDWVFGDNLLLLGSDGIFYNGKWATIIKDKTTQLNGWYSKTQLLDVINNNL